MNKFGIDVSNLPTQKEIKDVLSPSKIEAWERENASILIDSIAGAITKAVKSGKHYIVFEIPLFEIPQDQHNLFVSKVKPILTAFPYNYQVSHVFCLPNSTDKSRKYSIIEWDAKPRLQEVDMGIRLNMAMGYGLYPLNFMSKEHMEECLHFDRLEDPNLFDAIKQDLMDASEDEEHPFSTMDKLAFHPNMNPAKEVYEMVRYDPEFGLDDFVLLIPSGHLKNWNRYADLMDIYLMENIIAPDDYEPKVYPINSTLYPYVTLMKADSACPRGYSFYWESCWRDNEKYKDAIPGVPEHLWFVLRHVFRLTDHETTAMFLSLRPSIYKSYG